MLFSRKLDYEVFYQSGLKIILECEELKIADLVKHLGVVIDRKLYFRDHLDYFCKKRTYRI